MCLDRSPGQSRLVERKRGKNGLTEQVTDAAVDQRLKRRMANEKLNPCAEDDQVFYN